MNKEEKENLKKEIFEEFDKKSKSVWHKHPITILIAGFILTTILGGVVSKVFGLIEFESKQTILYKEKILEKKLEIVSELTLGIGETLASVERLVHNRFIYKDSSQFIKVGDDYERSILEWKAKSNSIFANLQIHFNDDVTSVFKEIDSVFFGPPSDDNVYINGLNILRFDLKELNSKNDSLETYCIRIMENRNLIKERMRRLAIIVEKDLKQTYSSYVTDGKD